MLRDWAPGPDWQGRNWHDLGFDVYAHFPEFPPDGDPTNDYIGDPGSVGTGEFQVDYQRTSEDFWRLVDHYLPTILITTSRGSDIGWELEGIEGGHGIHLNSDPARDWRSDANGNEHLPSRDSISPRSWRAISTYRAGISLTSALPLERLVTDLSTLNRIEVAIDPTDTSGNYLSGFMGLHGLYYNSIEPTNLAAGHIHVGRDVSVNDATAMMHATLDIVLREYPADSVCTRQSKSNNETD